MTGPFQPFEPHGHGGPRIREIPVRMLLPNVITVLAICAGLTGVRLAFAHRFESAVVMVLIAAFLDGIDGRLARALKATSRFGAQMDSLADIVNFGVAPALVLYAFVLGPAGTPGWIAALIFAIACGLRLARFNVLDEDEDRSGWEAEYFVGVPAPAGAGLVLLPVYLVFLDLVTPTKGYAYLASLFTVLMAFLLVSRLPVWSGKTFGSRVRRENALPVILAAVVYVLMLASYPWWTLSLSALAYFLFLPLSARAYSKRREREQIAAPPNEEQSRTE